MLDRILVIGGRGHIGLLLAQTALDNARWVMPPPLPLLLDYIEPPPMALPFIPPVTAMPDAPPDRDRKLKVLAWPAR